jgi:hypothetical protein
VYCNIHMVTTMRQLRTSKAPTAAEAAKRSIEQAGTTPKTMSRLADKVVIQLLNRKPNPVTERLTGIVELCSTAIHLTERISHFYVQGTGSDVALKEERYSILVELNARLSEYEWNPVVRNSVTVNSYFQISFEAGPNPALVKPGPFGERIDFNTPSGAAFFENRAVQWIVQNVGAVHRIRRCHRSQCRKWFFAVTDHQKYCGASCRKRDAAQGDDFKEKRRLYMRKYRDDESEREARAKRLAKGKGK